MTSTAPAPAPGASTRPRVPISRVVVAELAVYVGGPAAVGALGLIVARSLPGGGAQALVLGGVLVVFLAVGALVPSVDPSRARLRSVAWFGAILVFAALVPILLFEVFRWSPSRGVFLVDAGVVAVGAVALWLLCRHSLQQIAVFVAVAALLVALTLPTPSLFGGFDTTAIGVVLWLFGLAWFALGALGLVSPRRTALILGTVAAVVAPVFLLRQGSAGGEILGLVTAAGLLVTGEAIGDRAVQGIAIAAVVMDSGGLVAGHVASSRTGQWVALVVGAALLVAGVALAMGNGWAEPVEAGNTALPEPPTGSEEPISDGSRMPERPEPPAPPGPHA
jgi:hypothetical protein